MTLKLYNNIDKISQTYSRTNGTGTGTTSSIQILDYSIANSTSISCYSTSSQYGLATYVSIYVSTKIENGVIYNTLYTTQRSTFENSDQYYEGSRISYKTAFSFTSGTVFTNTTNTIYLTEEATTGTSYLTAETTSAYSGISSSSSVAYGWM